MQPVIIVLLFAFSSPDARTPIRRYEVTAANVHTPIAVQVAPNRITTLRFTRELQTPTLFCGDNQHFAWQAVSSTQVNIKGASQAYNQSTNCTMLTTSGVAVVLNVVIAESSKADSFIDVAFAMDDLPSTEVELTRRIKEVEAVSDQRVSAARHECEDRADQSFLQAISDGFVVHKINDRAIVHEVILTVTKFVRIGNRAVLLFTLDNQSPDAYSVGEVKMSFSTDGRPNVPTDAQVYTQKTIVERGDKTDGAISFDTVQLPDNAKFSVQVLERAGSRHPQVTGVRL